MTSPKTFNEEVANLELCKKLYELSGWDDTERQYNPYGQLLAITGDIDGFTVIPAYSAGYLLRKLPGREHVGGLHVYWNYAAGYERWEAGYVNIHHPDETEYQYADTPENALAKLAIELFRSGVLERTPKIYEKGKL